MHTSPELLMEKYVKTNDAQILTELVNQHHQHLYHYLVSLSDTTLAQDISQASWLKVIEKSAHYTINNSFKAWLFTIARHLLIDELRKQKRWQLEPIEETQAIYQKEVLSNEELITVFNKAITKLPFYQREAFIFQQEGLSIKEISEITNEKAETIKSRIRFARKSLKLQLGQLNNE